MSMAYTAADVPDQSGRTAFITGANSGIGYEAALVLAARGARVLLGCRSEERGTAARDRIAAAHPDADVRFVPIDLGDLESVAKAAADVASEERLDLLINNAGIMVPPRRETADGFESQFGINHLGHFALTGHLLGKLRDNPGSRVVTVSSAAHTAGRIDFGDIHATRNYNRQARYGMSKLANLLFTYELARRLDGSGRVPLAVACHPGVSETELSREFPKWMDLVKPLITLFSHDPPEAALPTLRAAVDPAVQAGEYYGPGGFLGFSGPPVRAKSTASSRDPKVAARLWDLSIELTGVDPGI